MSSRSQEGHGAPLNHPCTNACTVHTYVNTLSLTQCDIGTSSGPQLVSRPEAFCSSSPIAHQSLLLLPGHTTACKRPLCISEPKYDVCPCVCSKMYSLHY